MEPSLKHVLTELVHQLRTKGNATLPCSELADLIVAAYSTAKREAEEERRLLTLLSEKGSCHE